MFHKNARPDEYFPEDPDRLPDRPRKGRGAVSNPDGRFESTRRHAVADGWEGWLEDGAEDIPEDSGGFQPPPIRTRLEVDTSRKVIAWNSSPDIPFDRSVNPYRGCEHGCVYCFARPTHAYLGLSPGLDFESRLFYKPDAPECLRRELSVKSYRPAPIALGINTDAWQPVERSLGLTRRIVQVLADFRHPFTVVTKSALITRDLDLLAPMAARRAFAAAFSITTLDRDLARRLEPRAPTPALRLRAVRRLADAGIPVSVMAAPLIPGLTDHELENILAAAAEAGAVSAGYVLLRLPREIGGLFTEWLEAHAPDRKGRVLSLMRQCRDGALYNAAWGRRMTGSGPYAELIRQRFHKARARLGLDRPRPPLDCGQFRVPLARDGQLALF